MILAVDNSIMVACSRNRLPSQQCFDHTGHGHKPSRLPKLDLATSTAGLDFAPIWIAQRKGYFKEEGIDFEHILTTGGAVTMAALINGDVQFVSTAASDVLVARSRGERMLAVGIFPASLEWHIATNNKWLESRGLDEKPSG